MKIQLPYEAIQVCQLILGDDTVLDQLLLDPPLFLKLGYRCACAMEMCGDLEGAIEVLLGYKDLGIANAFILDYIQRLTAARGASSQPATAAAAAGKKKQKKPRKQ